MSRGEATPTMVDAEVDPTGIDPNTFAVAQSNDEDGELVVGNTEPRGW